MSSLNSSVKPDFFSINSKIFIPDIHMSRKKKIFGKKAIFNSTVPANSMSIAEPARPFLILLLFRINSKKVKFINHASRKNSKLCNPIVAHTTKKQLPITNKSNTAVTTYLWVHILANSCLQPSSRRPPKEANTRTNTRSVRKAYNFSNLANKNTMNLPKKDSHDNE